MPGPPVALRGSGRGAARPPGGCQGAAETHHWGCHRRRSAALARKGDLYGRACRRSAGDLWAASDEDVVMGPKSSPPSVPVSCLLEAGDVVLRDGMSAVAVRRRRCPRVAGVVGPRVAVRVERRLRGRRVSGSGLEVLAAGGTSTPSGAWLIGAVGTRCCRRHTGDTYYGRDPDQANDSHLSYQSLFRVSFVSWEGAQTQYEPQGATISAAPQGIRIGRAKGSPGRANSLWCDCEQSATGQSFGHISSYSE
jgi:hypothetical protein